MSNKDLTREHFEEILQDTINQVFSGKGMERHGHGSSFEDQPWRHISDNVGEGFALGQAMKKLMELRTFDNFQAWKREALGAIVYIVMSIMWKENKADSLIEEPEPKGLDDVIKKISVGGYKYIPTTVDNNPDNTRYR